MVTKNKFSQLNDKRFYFLNGVVSLPFHHPSLAEIVEFNQKKDKKLKNTSGRKKIFNINQNLISINTQKQYLKKIQKILIRRGMADEIN